MTRLDRTAVAWGVVAVAVSLVLVVLGSAGLTWFDAALVGYLFGTLFAIFGTVYRPCTAWLRPRACSGRAGQPRRRGRPGHRHTRRVRGG